MIAAIIQPDQISSDVFAATQCDWSSRAALQRSKSSGAIGRALSAKIRVHRKENKQEAKEEKFVLHEIH